MTTTHAPSEAAIQATMEQVTASVRARDTKGLVACFAENAVLEVVHGTYRGKAEIARSFDWTWQMLPKLEYRDAGMGMRIVDSMAVYEGVMKAVNADGTNLEALTLSTYEFDDDAKITRFVQVYNQWSLVQQAADQMTGLMGPLFRWFVRTTDAEMRKGLPAAS
ncbi:MAG: nuclear transport factor 2 family protein [Jiangellales bacterium]